MIDSIIDRKVIESYEGNEISAKLLNDNLLPIIPLPTIGDADTKEDDFVKSLHTSAKVLYQKKEALMELSLIHILLQHYMNNQFLSLNMQKLSAAAWCMFIILGIFLGIIYRVQRRNLDYL